MSGNRLSPYCPQSDNDKALSFLNFDRTTPLSMSVSLPQPSGSAKIYATAKKDWVIPARAKPGRKPKVPPQDDLDFGPSETLGKGKKSQNRSAQRAFRERRQSQFSELQAKLQQYEQGEIEKSVHLQNLGKRLKDENDQLRAENAALKAEIEQLNARLANMTIPTGEGTCAVLDPQRGRRTKRERNESLPPAEPCMKRMKTVEMPPLQIPACDTSSAASTPSHNMVSPISHTSMTSAIGSQDGDGYHTVSPMIVAGTATGKFTGCGMCTSSIDCVCQQLGMGDPASIQPPEENNGHAPSILDNLPPYQPPVPLPPRPKPILSTSIRPIDVIASNKASSSCSGDPSNCKACADNAFGRAFCKALGSTVCTLNPCPTCRSKSSSHTSTPTSSHLEPSSSLSVNPSLLQCCGMPHSCQRNDCSSMSAENAKAEALEHRHHQPNKQATDAPTKGKGPDTDDSSTVSADVVWKTLEAHPNAHMVNPSFGPGHLANLNLLAEVVARRSRCMLAPGETEPEPEDFRPRPRLVPLHGDQGNAEEARESKSAARVQIGYEEEQVARTPSDRTMVPRDVLQGHQHIITVQREGVRDAIALLDRQFGCS